MSAQCAMKILVRQVQLASARQGRVSFAFARLELTDSYVKKVSCTVIIRWIYMEMRAITSSSTFRYRYKSTITLSTCTWIIIVYRLRCLEFYKRYHGIENETHTTNLWTNISYSLLGTKRIATRTIGSPFHNICPWLHYANVGFRSR